LALPVPEPDQSIQLVGDLSQPHVDVVHALLVEREVHDSMVKSK
jgi:hypothetical protein